MHLSPDQTVFFARGPYVLNATIAFTWMLMLLAAVGAHLVTRHLTVEGPRTRWQGMLEIIVLSIEQQLREIGLRHARRYVGFVGTLFLFLALANVCTVIPGYEPPTASLSTTTALAFSVFAAVPFFGVIDRGALGYLKSYAEPTVLMLPFNIIGELSRSLALAVRLFGNMMSGALIVAILVSITPLIFPVLMTALGLLTGMVQAYIFAVLAAVYIAAATDSGAANQRAESRHFPETLPGDST